MKYSRTTTANRGSLKCNHCRDSVAAREGQWTSGESGEVFLCQGCTLRVRKHDRAAPKEDRTARSSAPSLVW